MMARVSDVLLGLDPRISSGGDPRVKPEDDGAFGYDVAMIRNRSEEVA
jgi:hypothetical protein